MKDERLGTCVRLGEELMVEGDEYMLVSKLDREAPGMRGPRGRPEAEARKVDDTLRGPVMVGRLPVGEGPEMGPIPPEDRLDALRPRPPKKDDLGLLSVLGGLELMDGLDWPASDKTPGKGTEGLARSRGLKEPEGISRAL